MSTRLTLVLIAVAGFLIRLYALLGAGGLLGAASSYDDGVYFSASALLLRGVLPYRDFVFVHPPGILYFLGIVSWLADPAHAFAAARVLMCAAGGVNVLLVGLLAARAAGPFGGIVAAALYAIFPDAVNAERSAYLEPVLNLACLSAMLTRERRPLLGGFLCGAACAVKLWGGIWIIAVLATMKRDRLRFLAGAIAAGVVFVVPIALPALDAFVSQTLVFQFSRPPDGTLSLLARVREIFLSGHAVATLLALIGLFRREARVFAIAMVLTIAGFLFSSSYWTQYNAHLAASMCVLAGVGLEWVALEWCARLRARSEARRRRAPLLGAALLLALALLDARAIFRRSPELHVNVPEGTFAFDPTWTLAAHHLPPHNDGAPVIVDSYGAMLLEATKGGRFKDTGAAFQSRAPQRAIRARLEASDYVLLGWRGNWQLNEDDRAWFASHFECTTPERGDLCVWKKRVRPLANAPSIADQTIQFLDGWYGVEGVPPKTWRWMGRRSVLKLPGAGVVRLRLEGDARLGFEMQGNTLVITADRTFVPARVRRRSSDTRELSVMLTKLEWQRADGGGASTSSPR
jgi:hypothetical protein